MHLEYNTEDWASYVSVVLACFRRTHQSYSNTYWVDDRWQQEQNNEGINSLFFSIKSVFMFVFFHAS